MWSNFINFCRSCIDPERSLGATPAGESGGGNTCAAAEDHSSEGYTTPRSLETPVQNASNLIRDPYASRLPSSLRHHNEFQRQVKGKQNDVKDKNVGTSQAIPTLTVSPTESIYTILIRLPPKGAGISSQIDNGNVANRTSIQVPFNQGNLIQGEGSDSIKNGKTSLEHKGKKTAKQAYKNVLDINISRHLGPVQFKSLADLFRPTKSRLTYFIPR